MERTFLCVDLHLRDAFPHLSGCPLFWQHELYVGIIHPTDFVIEPKFFVIHCHILPSTSSRFSFSCISMQSMSRDASFLASAFVGSFGSRASIVASKNSTPENRMHLPTSVDERRIIVPMYVMRKSATATMANAAKRISRSFILHHRFPRAPSPPARP